MAARRALRQLGELNAGEFRIVRLLRCTSQNWDEQRNQQRSSNPSFKKHHDGVLPGSWQDEDRRKRSLGFSSRNGIIPSGMAAFQIHQRVGLGHVRFSSTATEGAMSDVPGDAPLLPDFVDAAPEMTTELANVALKYANEIEAATSVSYPWTALLQEFINSVHVHTGLPWWGSIALSTVIVRALVFPLTVYQVKLTARFTLLRPELEKIKAAISNCNYDPEVVTENRKKMNDLFVKHKTNPFTPLIGALIQAPLFMCFFFGIRTMAENIESFKQGGALWFTDLSSSDPYYLLPVLTGLTFLAVVELGAADGMQGQPNMQMMKNIMRVCGVALVPLTMTFPTALFSYWLTSNLWTMAQGAALRNPRVKAILDIPETKHLEPALAKQRAPTSFSTALKVKKKAKGLAQ